MACSKNIRKSKRDQNGLPRRCSGKESACQRRRCKRCRLNPRVEKIPWRRKWQPTPVLLPGEFHGQRSLVDYSPWGHNESDRTEQLTLSVPPSSTETTIRKWAALIPAVHMSWICPGLSLELNMLGHKSHLFYFLVVSSLFSVF